MSAGFELRVDMGPLVKALRKVDKNIQKTLGKAVVAGAFTLETYSKLNITTTFHQRTGDLRSRWESKLDHSTAQKAWAHTAPLVVYARIQELGGVIRSTSGGGLVFQTTDGVWHKVMAVTIPARPFLRPAADNHSKDIFEAMASVLKSEIWDKGQGALK